MVFPTHVRRPPAPKHAFEDALDEARLTADDDLSDYLADALSNPLAPPAVGSLGDIAVANGYVAPASLARAYEADTGAEEGEGPGAVSPRIAAQALIAALAKRTAAAADLKHMRRRFAAENHPDRVPPDLRDEAVAAMAEVNAAIDRALKQLGAARRGGAT